MILVELALGALTVIVCSSLFFTDRLLKREAEVEKELSQETEAKKAKSKLDAEEDRARRKFEFYREHPGASCHCRATANLGTCSGKLYKRQSLAL
jgi:hypothetical protein